VNRRLRSIAAAAAALAGAGTAVVPQHAASLAVLAAATVAVVAAAFLLVLAGPLVTAERPRTTLDGAAARSKAPSLDPQGLRDARRDLAARGDGTLTPAVHRRLRAGATLRLAALGVDLDDAAGQQHARTLLGPASAGLLLGSPPAGAEVDARRTARTVHRTLDELDALVPPLGGRRDHHR
jgi:hypothetical protein